ncbi:MAG: DUF1844 domain-containing protein [Planctomycetes bacterium]|nr:DUF1844 domain-containing protein [Planctomycetota bacterium]
MSEGARPLPEPDLSFLAWSIATGAMVSLGLAKPPDGGEAKVDLGLAKHAIDVLAMLEHKTEGNRTEEETKVLRGLLYDLRMRYVEVSRGPGGA